MPQEFERNQSAGVGVREAADILGVSESHVRNLVKRGYLPSVRLGKRIVLNRATIEGLLSGEKPKRGRPRKEFGT